MKKMLLLLVLCVYGCLPFPAAAQEQEYVITEAELIQLEKISENLQISRQNLLLQANALTERLKAQELKANSLNSQLQTERQTLKRLRQSYNAYEKEAARQIADQQAIIDKQKDKLHRRTITIIILSAVLLIIGVITGMKYAVKLKFSLFRPP